MIPICDVVFSCHPFLLSTPCSKSHHGHHGQGELREQGAYRTGPLGTGLPPTFRESCSLPCEPNRTTSSHLPNFAFFLPFKNQLLCPSFAFGAQRVLQWNSKCSAGKKGRFCVACTRDPLGLAMQPISL